MKSEQVGVRVGRRNYSLIGEDNVPLAVVRSGREGLERGAHVGRR